MGLQMIPQPMATRGITCLLSDLEVGDAAYGTGEQKGRIFLAVPNGFVDLTTSWAKPRGAVYSFMAWEVIPLARGERILLEQE